MTITFNELVEFNHRIFRNIQGISIGFDEFDDLTLDPKAKAYAHRASRASELNSTLNLNELQHNAIDFIFKQTSWLPTRFGNGSYPVWYGSIDLKTSFHETLYHWHRVYIEAPKNFNLMIDKSIKTLRTVFTVNCKAALIDLRNTANQKNKLIHPDPAHYSYTQQIGHRIQQEGYPGLITKSARIKNGENIIVFNKKILSAPEHYQNYIYEYHLQDHKVFVKKQGSKTIVFSVHLSNVFQKYFGHKNGVNLHIPNKRKSRDPIDFS